MATGKKLYDILGVPENADKSTIKKAYFKLAQKYNPNIPENKEKFQQINNAYETLKDEEKRQLYDRYGDDYIEHPEQFQGGMFGGDPFSSVFDMFTGGMGGKRRQQGPRQARPIGQQVEVTLEQMYNGADIPVNITRTAKCPSCNGLGATEPGVFNVCDKCHGQGVYMATRRMGNMIMQQQVTCDQCRGEGKCCKDKSKICKQCQGAKIIREQKQISVHLDPGTPDGYQQIIYGEGNYEPDCQQGDFVAEFHMKQSKIFTREEADLFMTKQISFVEALCGVSFTLKHPSGDEITVFRKPGQTVGNDQVLCLRNMGMPVKGRIYEHGNLFIKFEVTSPESITPEQKQKLIEILATPEQKANIARCATLKNDGVKTCELVYVNPKNRTKSDAEQQGQDEYGDNQDQQQTAQCQAM